MYDADSKLAYLYGESKVTYMNMNLDAEKITMNMDSSMVYAEGKRDSTVKGGIKGKPVYKQGSERYDSERMSFNFKNQKGLYQQCGHHAGKWLFAKRKVENVRTTVPSSWNMPNTPLAMRNILTSI